MERTYLHLKRPKKSWIKWQNNITKLVEYCNARGWTIWFNQEENICYPKQNAILISAKLTSLEKMFYVLLHEVGHMVTMKRHDYKATRESRTKTQRIAHLQEELEAWDEGFLLAKKRGLQVNKRHFAQTKAEYIMLYCLWATKKELQKYDEYDKYSDKFDEIDI